jgi:hypothetical protein
MSEKGKFTPGPWELRPKRVDYLVDNNDGGSFEISRADHKYWIAHALTPENARLIAAAPELYEAARLACQVFARGNEPPNDWMGDDEHEAWRVLEDAMKKAEGAN